MLLLVVKAILTVIFVAVFAFFLLKCCVLHLKKKSHGAVESIAFFHPYCNAGGGGERVLWAAIRALQLKYPNKKYVVYTGDIDATEEAILRRAENRFQISIREDSVTFVYLKKRYLVEASMYPIFTLLGQSIGSVVLGMEALLKFVPDVYVDTMGYSFTMPLFKFLGKCKVGCYVHYPTISTDMLDRVSERRTAHNNRRFISRNPVLSTFKLLYYKCFSTLYKWCGRTADVILVNSSWTKGHISYLWQAPAKTYLVYPPCSTDEFSSIVRDDEDPAKCHIVSIAQFRPEKDHVLQIKAFSKLMSRLDGERQEHCRLILVGSCRTEEDMKLVDKLQAQCKESLANLEKNVTFKLNVPFSDLKKEMASATVAIHTMWNEHFGIGVVECLAAGLVTVAHDSGGPKMDIVVDYNGQPTGFLAYDEDSFADILEKIIQMSPNERLAIQKNARESVKRFSEEEFAKKFVHVIELLFKYR